jgi:hypothetical protein
MASSLQPYEQNLVKNVQLYGCQITHVFGDGDCGPNFSYSIGFMETIKQPDCIVFGLSKQLMHSMLNELYRQGKDGLQFCDGLKVSDLLAGFDCVLRRVHHSNLIRDYFASGIWYYPYRSLPEFSAAYQIVWPSAQTGHFPWDDGCDAFIQESQPSLYQESALQ